MAGFISYNVVNDQQFNASVKAALKEVSNLKAPFRLIANDFYISQKAIFKLKSAGGYPDFEGPKIGQKRKGPLDPSRETPTRRAIPASFDGYTPYQYYKEKETRMARGYPLLKRKGALEAATTTSTSPDSILIIENTEMEIGTDLPYANFHQEGTKRMPMRKFLFIGPESRLSDGDGKQSLSGRLGRWTRIIESHVLKISQNRLENGL